MSDPAKAYEVALHNISALTRLERHLVIIIAKMDVGSEERFDLISVLRRVHIYRSDCREAINESRTRLIREITPDMTKEQAAAWFRPATRAEGEAIASDAEETWSKSLDLESEKNRLRRMSLEREFLRLAGVRGRLSDVDL